MLRITLCISFHPKDIYYGITLVPRTTCVSDISRGQVSNLFVYMLSLGYRSRTWKMFEIFLGHKNDTFPGPKTKQAAARISYQFQDSNPEPLISWALPVPLWHSVRAEEQCTLVFIPLYTEPGAWARRVTLTLPCSSLRLWSYPVAEYSARL